MKQIFTDYITGAVRHLKISVLQTCLFLSFTTGHLFIASSAYGQEPTFYETFDNTPRGEVPEGWRWYSLGSDGNINWTRSSYGFFGPPLMTSGAEYALPGEIDEDWLVTPQITPKDGDHLIFDSGQEYVWFDYQSTFHVLVSTASASRDDFTEIKQWTETEFPGYPYEERLMIDLSAYAGTPIYIAFVHKNPVEFTDPPPMTENWYLDNVEVRPLKDFDYAGAEVNWSFPFVIKPSTSNTSIVVGTVVRATGDIGTANVTSMTFTKGESAPGDVKIKEAILYTTYSNAFITSDPVSGISADVFGSVVDPGETFVIEGDQELTNGDNYFWLVYILEGDESKLTYPYPTVDANFVKVVVKGVEHDTDVSSTAGAHPVVPSVPVNDNYADAIELLPSGIPTRYGSHNDGATFEDGEFDKPGYCAVPVGVTGKDGSNSVWWHFKAPAEGVITVDLSTCDFNTLLVIQDADFKQLACNKDIDEEAFIIQSKITDFQVEAGKDYYIRVTGEADWPGDPNAAKGVVHLDFSFTTPLGVDENDLQPPLSALYPNPATGTVYTDLFLKKDAEVILDVVDLMGRTVLSDNKGMMEAGLHEKVSLDVSVLRPGSYVVRMRGSEHAGALRKMIVVKD